MVNSQAGLVMVGLSPGADLVAETTTAGVEFRTDLFAAQFGYIFVNCLVSVNDTTLINFGGSDYGYDIATHTVGDDGWQVVTDR